MNDRQSNVNVLSYLKNKQAGDGKSRSLGVATLGLWVSYVSFFALVIAGLVPYVAYLIFLAPCAFVMCLFGLFTNNSSHAWRGLLIATIVSMYVPTLCLSFVVQYQKSSESPSVDGQIELQDVPQVIHENKMRADR